MWVSVGDYVKGSGVNLGVEFSTLISPYDKEEMTAVRLKIGIDF